MMEGRGGRGFKTIGRPSGRQREEAQEKTRKKIGNSSVGLSMETWLAPAKAGKDLPNVAQSTMTVWLMRAASSYTRNHDIVS